MTEMIENKRISAINQIGIILFAQDSLLKVPECHIVSGISKYIYPVKHCRCEVHPPRQRGKLIPVNNLFTHFPSSLKPAHNNSKKQLYISQVPWPIFSLLLHPFFLSENNNIGNKSWKFFHRNADIYKTDIQLIYYRQDTQSEAQSQYSQQS